MNSSSNVDANDTERHGVPQAGRCVHTLLVASILWLIHMMPSAAAAQSLEECWAWSPVQTTAPARHAHALAYDEFRQKIVLFGGTEEGIPMNDTWELGGSPQTWSDVSPTAGNPPAREGHAMVFDSALPAAILFGGFDSAVLDDTWTWNGSVWTDVSPAAGSPPARADHAMAPTGNGAILFGGWDRQGSYFGDTWRWTQDQWTLVATDGPSPRAHHAMALLGNGRLLLFGGNDGAAELGDTWQWDGSAWIQLMTTGPQPTANSKMAGGDLTILVVDGTETWLWHGNGWLRQIGPAPSPTRTQFALVGHDWLNYLHGGIGPSGDLSDTWFGFKPLCIPAATTWSLAIMALSVLTWGSILLIKRRSATM